MIRTSTLGLVLMLSAMNTVSRADVTTIGWWRLGEADPGAAVDGQAQDPTVASTGAPPLIWDSGTNGSTFYRAETAPAKRLRLGASTLAIEITTGSNYPGYHSATLPSTETTNVGLEIWAKADASVVAGDQPSDIVIWNGQENGWGYGIVQQTGTWVAALYPPAGTPFTPIATAPLATGVWTHLALVESGGTWTFYVNGKKAGELAATARMPEFRFNLGESYNRLGMGFDGHLDEARLFTFAPGAFELKDLNFVSLPPGVTRTKPARIPLQAVSKVSVSGSNLLAATSVTLANRPVKGLVRISDTSLRFRVPKGIKPSLKKVPLTVVSPEGSTTKRLKVDTSD